MNLTQIGVKSIEKKGSPSSEVIATADMSIHQSLSSVQQGKANSLNSSSKSLSASVAVAAGASPTSAINLVSGASLSLKDAKKSNWQNRGIYLPSSSPESLPPTVSASAIKGMTSPVGKSPGSWVGVKASSGQGQGHGHGHGHGQDNNSDDGAGGVSNSEVEDEWLEVKQRRPKVSYSSASSNICAGRGGQQSTTSASTLKGVRSRSTSPVSASVAVNSSGSSSVPESFAAVLSKKEETYDGTYATSPAPTSTPVFVPSSGPTVQIPVVSTMGFRAAVMSGQSDSSSATSFTATSSSGAAVASYSFAQTLLSSPSSQSVPGYLQQPQSLSAMDFPAMPSSSSTVSKVSTLNSNSTFSATALVSVGTAPTAASVVALGAAAAAAVPVATSHVFAAAVIPTAIDIVDTGAATSGVSNTAKKLSKAKKKAGKNGIEITSEKENAGAEGTRPTATTNPIATAIVAVTDSIGTSDSVGVPSASVAAIDINVDVGFSVKNGNKLVELSPPPPPQLPLMTSLLCDSKYAQVTSARTELFKDPRLLQMPVLTAQGSYVSHITQSSYDMHSVSHVHVKDRHNLHNGDINILSHQSLVQTGVPNIQENTIRMPMHSTDMSNVGYQYSSPLQPNPNCNPSCNPKGGDEDEDEDDDDLFKAISYAHAIDFDPSFTANSLHMSNNLHRPISCTLSPLSRRIGSRSELDLDMSSCLPPRLPVSSENMRGLSPYENTSLLDPTDRSSPSGPLSGGPPLHSHAEGFLSGISFDFFSSLLHPSTADGGSSGSLMRKEGSSDNIPQVNPIDFLPSSQMTLRYSQMEQSSPTAMETMKLNDLQSGLSPHCNEYRYTGSLPEISERDSSPIYLDPDLHIPRSSYQMPALTPIPPSNLMPALQPSYITNASTMDSHHTSLSHSMPISHYKNGILDLSQNLQKSYIISPILFTAKELSVATNNFSVSNLIQLMEAKEPPPLTINNNSIAKTNRCAKLILDKDREKEKERERESCICTFAGTMKNSAVVIKIITPSKDIDINNALQSQYLADLRVLSEVSHPNILPLLGFTFRPCARVFRIPSGTINANKTSYSNVYNHNLDNNYCNNNINDGSKSNIDSHCTIKGLQHSGSVGYYTLSHLLQDTEKRKIFPWKMRIRTIICVLRALSYLHEGDSETGRCPIAHW